MLTMIVVYFFFLIVAAVIRWFERPMVRKLAETETVADAMRIRSIVARRRRITAYVIIGLYTAYYVIKMVFVVLVYMKTKDIYYLFFNLCAGILAIGVLGILEPFYELRGNISSFDRDLFYLGHKEYTLFLRGFYTDVMPEAFQNFNEKEKILVRELKGLPEAVAVGNPHELDAPRGATRLYLENDSWEQDVKEMMDRASLIIILVNDSPSCVTEIIYAIKLLEKTVFIVDDKQKYAGMRESSEELTVLPVIPEGRARDVYFYLNNGEFVVRDITNYDQLGRELMSVCPDMVVHP